MAEETKAPVYDDDGLRRQKTESSTDKTCPSCGGVMAYSPADGALRCPYCETVKEIIAEQGSPDELDFETADKTASHDWGAAKKRVVCNSCGAESIYDELQTASTCPYCGSNQVMDQGSDDSMAPGGVIPFAITVKQAAENFKAWIKGKLFTPKAAKEGAKPDAFKGVYLPFWTFDAKTSSKYTAQYGINRTVVHHDKEGKEHTEIVTDWYPTSGVYDEDIDDQTVPASTQHDNQYLREVEPFDTNHSKKYAPEYVAGYVAERYSIGLKDAWEKAKAYIQSRLSNNIEDVIRDEHHADQVSGLQFVTNFTAITYKYLLLPVWISAFKYNGKVYQFMVNGQTGKVAGKAPISALRVAVAVLIGLAVIGLIVWFAQG